MRTTNGLSVGDFVRKRLEYLSGMFGAKDWEQLQKIYTHILSDIEMGLNLQKHQIDVNDAIVQLKDIIELEKLKGDTKTLDNILNDFFYLQYRILEKI